MSETPVLSYPYEQVLKDQGRVAYWRDKKVRDLSHEELLQAYFEIAQDLDSERRWNRTVLEMNKAKALKTARRF